MANFLVDALKRAGSTDSTKLKNALAATKNFKGVTGTFSMDKNHNPVKSVTIIQMKNGEATFLKKLAPEK